ncbi:hypothetical protein [Paraburkholderia dilworthii]|uniref:hypothetical protein n=1 Tax=Paraburkholderia dilworthii TaxID=948106 RepID=UPI0004032CC3|nr:hypothetical protein [Paraburkholderia dilworthii]
MESQQTSEFRRRIEQTIAAFEARYGIRPTVVVLSLGDAELWFRATAEGVSLFEGLAVHVNPLATSSGVRDDGVPVHRGNGVLH